MKSYIFNQKLLKKKYDVEINLSSKKNIEKRQLLQKWKGLISSRKIRDLNESQLREIFIVDIFCNILDYINILQNIEAYNIKTEQKTKLDATKADLVLGYFSDIGNDYRVAIELKGPGTDLDAKQLRKNDNRTPVEQGFSYLPKYGKKCNWLIITNYNEIRLYNSSDATEYEKFYLKDISDNDELFKKFMFLLSNKHLISKNIESKVFSLWKENNEEKAQIEKKFYELYRKTRIKLFEDIYENNGDVDIKVCLQKTQKILDRFIFICFAEHKHLLPRDIYNRCINFGENLSMTRYGVWEQVKGLFESIDIGNENQDINKFNGGLFSKDEILDNLKIPNKCFTYMNNLSQYDFNSDLDENILGHIFEKTISDLEEIKAELDGVEVNRKEGKRNRDGIFYTPNYITKYIVENTIGKYLELKRNELGELKLPILTEEDYKTEPKTKIINHKKVTESTYKTNNIQRHINFWVKYRDIVKKIKILDPACGSGAFLNEAFNYLHKTGEYINNQIHELTGEYSFFDLSKNILENNIYGVDKNEESVEITKLSLWLKTADKYSSLTSLDNNIKCGNSLISENKFDKSFDWNIEFEDIMKMGGFDVIIGNPPYVATKKIDEEQRNYFWDKYSELLVNEIDLYELFIYEFSKNKLKKDGFLGFITPNTYYTNKSFVKLRNYLFNDISIKTIIDFPYRFFPFEDVNKETAIILLHKDSNYNTNRTINLISINKDKMKSLKVFNSQTYEVETQIEVKDIIECLNSKISINFDEVVLKMIKSEFKLSKYLQPHKGWMSVPTETTCNGLIYNKKFLNENDLEINKELKMIVNRGLEGKNIHRYYMDKVDKYVNINDIDKKTISWHRNPKIIMQRIVGQNKNKIMATADLEGHIILPNANLINLIDDEEDILFFLGLLNSKAINYYYKRYYGESNTNITVDALNNIPIGNIETIDKLKIIEHVSCLLDTYKLLNEYVYKLKSNISNRFNISEEDLKNLEKFYLLTTDKLINEIEKKIKCKFRLKERDEIDEYVTFYKEKIMKLLNTISTSEQYINNQIYMLYGLTNIEINIIESS